MTFLAQSSSKTLLKLQLSHLKFERTIMSSKINSLSREMNSIQEQDSSSENGTSDLENNQYYKYLQSESERYDLQQENIDNEISLLNSEIEALGSLVSKGIQDSCKFTISGG